MTTIEILTAEAKRLRSLADRLDAFALELAGTPTGVPQTDKRDAQPSLTGLGEFSNLTQGDAIVKAIKTYGPQSTRDLFERLNAGGQSFKKVAYVTALLPRLKDKIERTTDGRIQLKKDSA